MLSFDKMQKCVIDSPSLLIFHIKKYYAFSNLDKEKEKYFQLLIMMQRICELKKEIIIIHLSQMMLNILFLIGVFTKIEVNSNCINY